LNSLKASARFSLAFPLSVPFYDRFWLDNEKTLFPSFAAPFEE
jgi:hypothetical protein